MGNYSVLFLKKPGRISDNGRMTIEEQDDHPLQTISRHVRGSEALYFEQDAMRDMGWPFRLVYELLKKLDFELKHEISHWAAHYVDETAQGSSRIKQNRCEEMRRKDEEREAHERMLIS
ncbi:uncharacterized protein LOC142547315 isoform X2 [Primulina tabacum]|uniref:uncharacterized protein LOC142547315 isoform X2 n=1 Tax=Primulina tabacum TaxID=48773 RepID=UPI003F596FDC